MWRCIERSFEKNWYKKRLSLGFWFLAPAALLFRAAVFLKQCLYQSGWFTVHAAPLPVIVVGNITLGGSGKTPLVIHLAERLTQQGWRPGIVSRGYRGTATREAGAFWVTAVSDPQEMGDEAVLMARRLGCPVAVARRRVEAVQLLVQSGAVDVILSDDGLQHREMARAIEIAVVSSKGFGNGWLLPAGPLREPVGRLREVDLIVTQDVLNPIPMKTNVPYYGMALEPTLIYSALDLKILKKVEAFPKEKLIHAIAGIGCPDQFFQLLAACGFQVIPHPFPDHHRFAQKEILFHDDLPIFMTEKDWVKCRSFVGSNHWVLSVNAVLDSGFDRQLVDLLEKSLQGSRHGQTS